jgi:hypothetical protein
MDKEMVKRRLACIVHISSPHNFFKATSAAKRENAAVDAMDHMVIKHAS